jgi:hypothetical protein
MSYFHHDPCPGTPLNQITPIITRAYSWLARVANDLPHDKNIQYSGAIFMLAGMHHHFCATQAHLAVLADYLARHKSWDSRWAEAIQRNEEFTEAPPQMTPQDIDYSNKVAHEAVAYLNRLGQFHAFAKANGQQQLTKTTELMLFRNKNAAHRSIDCPRKEDDYLSMWSQATSLGGFYRMFRGENPIFQIPDHKDAWVEFSILEDHPKILLECMSALESIAPAW